MKTKIKVLFGVLFLTLVSFKVYQAISQENELIIGAWIGDGNSSSDRWVFTADNIMKDYGEDILYKTYTWEITESGTPSGLTISHLILTNSEDENEVYRHEINGLSEERLALVYQRPGGGLGKLSVYNKQ